MNANQITAVALLKEGHLIPFQAMVDATPVASNNRGNANTRAVIRLLLAPAFMEATG